MAAHQLVHNRTQPAPPPPTFNIIWRTVNFRWRIKQTQVFNSLMAESILRIWRNIKTHTTAISVYQFCCGDVFDSIKSLAFEI
jgi:hypothetical protein